MEIKIFKDSQKIFFMLLLAPIISYANVELKLNCRLQIYTDSDSGASERKTRNVVMEVYQSVESISILPNDDALNPVTTNKNPFNISTNNYSNANKWEITNIDSLEGKKNIRVSIQIDRNTGAMNYYSDYNKGQFITRANGNCEKIDTTKKKF